MARHRDAPVTRSEETKLSRVPSTLHYTAYVIAHHEACTLSDSRRNYRILTQLHADVTFKILTNLESEGVKYSI